HLLCAAAKELHRAYRARAAEDVSSALGAPSAAEIAAAWTPAPRPLRQALLVGSKLVDLSALHPVLHLRSPDGKHTAGQTGGLKPWFAATLPSIPYSTAMRYRQLARLLRQALDIPPALPLEWLLSDAAPSSLTRDSTLLPHIPSLRRKLATYLSPFRSQAALKRALEKRIGIVPCPFARRSPRRTPAQRVSDLASDAALLDRYIATLAAKIRAARPLSPPERRALAYLRALGIPVT
ncbi:MAG: hypothetical protein IK066_04110, partial [Kiritimatiellae bacterium]|nr:hypothetical protein [Kiritimatiellia bacterium]